MNYLPPLRDGRDAAGKLVGGVLTAGLLSWSYALLTRFLP